VIPETRYARSGDVNIAYQVVGDGPLDLVYVPGWVSNIDLMWEDPSYAAMLERFASFARLILFDKRGTGLSDPVPVDELPDLEQRMDDVRAVMDAVGSERAAIVGHSEGGSMSALFAATFPDRVGALVMMGCFAKRIRTDDYPWAPTWEERLETIQDAERRWPPEDYVEVLAPSRAHDEGFRRWLGRYLRNGASPKAAAALLRMNSFADITPILPSIRVPTLLLYRIGDGDVRVEEGRFIAARIPRARYVELEGADHCMWTGNADGLLDEIEDFLTGIRRGPAPDRILATVLFTDIVDSTRRAAELGDRAWSELLGRHHTAVRRELARFRGRELDTAGDGFLATFDGPARALRCARSAVDAVTDLGLTIRAGVHTGEVEVAGDTLRGIAVHTGARIAALAGPGEVFVSRTVVDLVAGSGLAFGEAGEHELKGIPGAWQVYRLQPA
jgi:pimeloyl-ACP methyl ester carboxylesterase